MPKNKVTKLKNYQLEFKDLVDAKPPLRLAGDIGAARRKLIAEYPDAVGAIDLVLRGCARASGAWTPILLTGQRA